MDLRYMSRQKIKTAFQCQSERKDVALAAREVSRDPLMRIMRINCNGLAHKFAFSEVCRCKSHTGTARAAV